MRLRDRLLNESHLAERQIAIINENTIRLHESIASDNDIELDLFHLNYSVGKANTLVKSDDNKNVCNAQIKPTDVIIDSQRVLLPITYHFTLSKPDLVHC